jgi:aminoglycoside phosphotransferase (APT) family kinase protein
MSSNNARQMKIPFELVAQKIAPQSKLLRAWPLTGGVSAQVTALEIERADGRAQTMIVRQHGSVDLKRNPQIAADEFKLLQILQSAGLATPTPYYLDQSGEIFPTPYLVIEYIAGTPAVAPADVPDLVLQLATHLASIHALDCSNSELSFLPRLEEVYAKTLQEPPPALDEVFGEARIRATLTAAWPLPQRNPSVLLHGDFWPGNTLWRDGQLVAVIDWEDAKVGDPLADVANSRLELLWAFGIKAMQRFTDHYRSIASIDWTNLPYWDLCAALRHAPNIAQWELDNSAEQAMREGLRFFISQAFNQLAHEHGSE